MIPITTTKITDLVAELVAAGQPHCENSLDGPVRPPQETRVAQHIAPLLDNLGFNTSLVGREPDRRNLLAVRRFGHGPVLLLNDHLDTYPAGPPERWSSDPYSVTERDGRLYGRGTSDTRGNIAAMLLALEDLAASPPRRGTVVVALTVDEERNGRGGASWLLDHLAPWPDASITIEPTGWSTDAGWGLGVAVQHTGHALIDLTITGRASHIWRPDTGINPARALMRILATLTDDPPEGWPVSIVALDAGERGMAQFTPLNASARLAIVGLPSGLPAEHLTTALRQRGEDQLEDGCVLEVKFVDGPTFVAGTERLDSCEPIVRAVARAYEDNAGEAPRLYVKPAYCDTIRFRHAGIPAITFGPGEDGWDVYDESIGLDRIHFAVAVLHDAIRTYLDPR